MLRSGLRNGRRRRHASEDINPMEGAINIVDAMLVFSCGLMLSLVIYWNIDIKQEAVPIAKGADVSQVDDIKSDLSDTENDSSGNYQRVGTVYVDPDTGKMYLVDEEAAGSSNSGGNNASSNNASSGDGNDSSNKAN